MDLNADSCVSTFDESAILFDWLTDCTVLNLFQTLVEDKNNKLLSAKQDIKEKRKQHSGELCNYKNKTDFSFLFVVESTALKLQISEFYLKMFIRYDTVD